MTNKFNQQNQSQHPNILTINVEDFFQVGAFESFIRQENWNRFETRIYKNLEKVFRLIGKHGHQATFFVFGWIAERYPEIVQEIIHQGYEVASRGYWHRGINEIPPEEFKEDLLRTHEALIKAGANQVIGYRSGIHSRSLEDSWALKILSHENYLYDSSLLPPLKGFPNSPWKVESHRYRVDDTYIWELPISTTKLLHWTVPIGGGNYFRQFPFFFLRRASRNWHKKTRSPFVLYFHTWELDIEQPRVYSASIVSKIRQYRNLHKMGQHLEFFLKKYPFTSCSGYLAGDIPSELETNDELSNKISEECCIARSTKQEKELQPKLEVNISQIPITIVIPCYNEVTTLPYLVNTLSSALEQLTHWYDIKIIFIDDCSSDSTYNSLVKLFGNRQECTILRHEENQGVAGAIKTGISTAETEIICSMDCDCTYDPHEFLKMIPLLAEDVDIVTASPYHPKGRVLNVPNWRLFLSRTLSRLYSLVLSTKMYTFTSCFRVYKKSTVSKLDIHNSGFLGVGEMIALGILSGLTVKEFPTLLESRIFGESKMKIVTTIFQHLKLLFSIYIKKII